MGKAEKLKPIPVTVITGFLGSGKTTLINRILSEDHGIRFAIIENEFGDVGIDQDLVIREQEEIIEMLNGCICCTVRGDLIRVITKLINSEKPPEHILIETTGLADPSPVAQSFLTDPFIAERTMLDGIITLVDTHHITQQLISTPEAKDQIAFADVILLNKTDLIEATELQAVENRVREINRFAVIHTAVKGNVDLRELFNIGGFNVERALTVNPQFMEIEYPFEYGGFYDLSPGEYTLTASPNGEETDIKILLAIAPKEQAKKSINIFANPVAILFSGPEHKRKSGDTLTVGQDLQQLQIVEENSTFNITVPKEATYMLFTQHHPEEFSIKITNKNGTEVEPFISKEFRGTHSHDDEVSSVGIELEGELDAELFWQYINGIIRAFGNELYRYKGVIAIKDTQEKVVLQGVHMLFEIQPSVKWKKDEPRKNAIIFIGKNLDRNILTQGFVSCMAE